MATREELIEQVRLLLAKAGFAVSQRCEVRPISFDVVARRDRALLIVKVLGNVDALNERVAQELRTLARFLTGTPLLVGERSSAGPLEDGVAYNHREIPVLTVHTLESFLLQNEPPVAYATPGGLNVGIDGALLRRIREQRALSLGVLAQVAGVSRRAIQMYEQGMRATIEAALRLEEFLGEALVTPIDPFDLFRPSPEEPKDPAKPVKGEDAFEQQVFQMLQSVGFIVVPTTQSPFDAMAQAKRAERETILTGVHSDSDAQTRRRAQLLSSISSVTEREGMIVIRRELRVTNLQGTPVVQRAELEKLRDPAELRQVLEERRRRKETQT